MNLNKNTLYYVNLGAFLLLTVYSLLFSINAFDFANMDMNAGLCAVMVTMVIALLMYLVQATRIANVLYAMPIAKVTIEIISTLILLTVACVIRIYCVEEFVLVVEREGVVLACMLMAYLVARMLNQYGFITLLVLTPWPLLLNSYGLEMAQLFTIAKIMAVLVVLTAILYMVRMTRSHKNIMLGVYAIAVAGFVAYLMNSLGKQIVEVPNPMQYITMYNSLITFEGFEKFYFIGIITAAILGGIRMWFGSGNCNSIVAFAASAGFVAMTVCGLDSQYIYVMYPILAIVASGSCGIRPIYMDEEIRLNDNLDGVKPKAKKKVETSFKDETELDNMLDEIETNKPYSKVNGPFNPVKFAADNADDELPIELQMYDFGAGSPEPVAAAPAPTPTPVPTVEQVVETVPVVEATQVEPVVSVEPTPQDVEIKLETPVIEEAEPVVKQMEEEVAEVIAKTETIETVVEVVDEVMMEAQPIVEVVKEVIPEPVVEVVKEVIPEPVVEAVKEVIPEPVDVEVVEEVIPEPVVEAVEEVIPEPVVEVVEEVIPETVVEAVEEVIPEPVDVEVAATTVSEPVFEMPTFAMDAAEFVKEPEPAPVVEETPVMVVEEAATYDIPLVVTEETSGSVSVAEEFEMPTFAMDLTANESVSSVLAEEPAEVVLEEVVETVAVPMEEAKEDVIVAAEDAGSIAMTEEFQMPTFEMNTVTEAADIIEEMSSVKSGEMVEEAIPEVVNETPEEPVIIQNPVFIQNPINFNRTRTYDSETSSVKDYGFEISAPTFETMGSFLADNKDNAFPEFEIEQGAMEEFASSFVAEETPATANVEQVADVIDNSAVQITETVDSVINVAETTAEEIVTGVVEEAQPAAIFEYAEETETVGEIEKPGFMAADFETADLVSAFSSEPKVEETAVEEAVVETFVEPENIELGLELGDDVSFGQSQSYTDWYDYDAEPQPFIFDEPETAVEEKVTDVLLDDEEFDITKEYVYDDAAYGIEEEGSVEAAASKSASVVSDDEEFDITKEYIYDDDEYYDDEEAEASEAKVAAKTDEFEVYDWDAADAEFAFEDDEKSEDVVTAAKVDEDYFDWSSYEGYDFEDGEGESDDVVVKVSSDKKEDDLYEEFVWTDEMIKAMEAEDEKKNSNIVEDIVEEASETIVEEIKEVIEEVAVAKEVVANMEYDYTSDEPDQYEVFKSSGNFVPEVEEVVDESQYEVFQSSGNFVPEVEEAADESQYEVFQSSGNFVPEVEEVADESQYEVFQSSGNFVPEVEEVVDESQYEVFQSSGNFVPEVEEVVEEVQYKTYGKDDVEEKNTESNTSKAEPNNKKEFGMDFPDFDLDLPDF